VHPCGQFRTGFLLRQQHSSEPHVNDKPNKYATHNIELLLVDGLGHAFGALFDHPAFGRQIPAGTGIAGARDAVLVADFLLGPMVRSCGSINASSSPG